MTTNKRWISFALGIAVGIGVAVAAAHFAARKAPSEPAGPAGPAPAKALYQCPMHPSIVSDKPGTCPICGMKLRKIDTGSSSAPSQGEAGPQGSVAGHAIVTIPQWRQQLIGVTTAEAGVRPLRVKVRTVGKIAYDPELYTAITEYHEALLSREKVKDSPWPDVQEQATALVRASRTKLKIMGLADAQIDSLAATGAPTNLLFGQAGGTVWVYAQVYESDAALVAPGQDMEVTLPALPGRVLRGDIKAVDPVLDPNTRTVRVRAEISDEGGLLKPQMFVNATIEEPLGEALAVPADAVLDTGTRKLAFVEIGDGEFEPREVKVGRLADGYYEVLSGLKAGEKVVTRANFLIDSESRLRATGLKASGEQK